MQNQNLKTDDNILLYNHFDTNQHNITDIIYTNDNDHDHDHDNQNDNEHQTFDFYNI